MPVWMMPPGCVMPSAYDYQSHCQRFIYIESVTRFATSFCAISGTHALVTAEQLAHEFGLGIAIVEEQLQQLREQGLVMNLQQDIWVSDEVFRRLRLRSLQAAREATRPVAATTYARLLLERQGVLPATDGSPALFASTSPGVYEGVDGVMRVIEQLAGVGLPASLWESQILPARVRDYSSEMLDELLATGAVIWSGQKKLGEDDGLVALHLQEYAAESFTPAEADQANRSALQQAIVAVLADGGAWFAQQISQRIRDKIGESVDLSALQEALWALVWQGVITSDIWAPLRALTRSSSNARTSTRRSHRARRGRPVYAQPVSPRVSYNTPNLAGRWSLLQVEPLNDTERMLALAENMLDRYGIISRQAVIAENIPGGFPSMQTLCRSMEDSGRIMRGRFVEGLGGAQFAERLTIDRLRDLATQATQTRHYTPVALSANDPANVWGNLLHLACTSGNAGSNASGGCAGGRFWRQIVTLSGARWQKNAGLAGKRGITRPRGFPRADYRTASRTTAALYANRSE